MNKKEKIKFIFDYLIKLFPNPKTELNYYSPFQLMIAVILSAQTTDKQVNKVTDKLFKKINNPLDIVKFWEKELLEQIKSIWLYKWKTKNIFSLSKIMISEDYCLFFNQLKTSKSVYKLFKKYWYYISNDWKELKRLPWIWEKTAKVIVHVLYNVPVIAVDTHVHRISNRLWLVKTKTPLQTSKLLEKNIDNYYKQYLHHCMILFWRYYCGARNPKCEECKLKKICNYYKKNKYW